MDINNFSDLTGFIYYQIRLSLLLNLLKRA